MIAELIARITADTSGLNKAENALKQFEHNVTSVFKRQPAGEMRAEAAIGGFIRQLTAGDVPGAIEALTRRMNVFGLVGSVAIGGIVLGITKAIQASNELNAKFESMNATLSKTPSTAMGMDALASMTEENASKLGDVAGQNIMAGIGERMKQLPRSMVAFLQSVVTLNPLHALEEDEKIRTAEGARNAAISVGAITQTTEALKAQGAARIRMAEITEAQASGDAQLTAELKAQDAYAMELYKAEEQRTAIYAKMGDAYTNFTQEQKDSFDLAMNMQKEGIKEGAGRGRDVALDTAERTAAATKEQITTQMQIAGVKEKGLTADVEKNALAAINIQHLQAQLDLLDGQKGAAVDLAKAELNRAIMIDAGEKKRDAAAKTRSGFEAHGQLSLEELAGIKRGGPIGGSLQTQITQAHEVQRLMKMSEQERLAGHPMEAYRLFARAQEFKNAMPMLRESEKSPEMAFLTALNAASVFTDMKKYLETIAGAVSKDNPFLNKP